MWELTEAMTTTTRSIETLCSQKMGIIARSRSFKRTATPFPIKSQAQLEASSSAMRPAPVAIVARRKGRSRE